jgi:hypothetical protein
LTLSSVREFVSSFLRVEVRQLRAIRIAELHELTTGETAVEVVAIGMIDDGPRRIIGIDAGRTVAQRHVADLRVMGIEQVDVVDRRIALAVDAGRRIHVADLGLRDLHALGVRHVDPVAGLVVDADIANDHVVMGHGDAVPLSAHTSRFSIT